MDQAKYDVFISYSRKDSVVAQKIKNILECNGLNFFGDVNDLTMDYAETITTVIQRCRAVFAVLSESSINSQWWRKEIELAQKLNIPIVFIADNYKYRETLPNYIRQSIIVKYDYFIDHAEEVINHFFHPSTSGCHYQPSPSVDVKPCPSPSMDRVKETNNKLCYKRINPRLLMFFFIITAIVVFIVGVVKQTGDDGLAKSVVKSPPDDTLVDSLEYEMYHARMCSQRQDDIERMYDEIESLERKRIMMIAHHDYLLDDEYKKELMEITMAITEKKKLYDSLRCEYESFYSRDTVSIEDINSIQNKDVESHQSDNVVKTSLIVVISILVCLSIILIIVLIQSRKRANRLKTSLMIVSDSKAKAIIGTQKVILEKGNVSNVILPYGEQQMELNYTDFNGMKQINCFIGGSTQLQAERDALRATISVVYNKWKEKKFQILSFTYEDFDRKFVNKGQQHMYDNFIENEADMAVFIIKGDVGDKTVLEFDKAYETFKKRQKPSIVVYRDINCSLGKTAEELKSKIESAQQYWIDYGTLNELKYHFQDILSSDLWSIYYDEFSAVQ